MNDWKGRVKTAVSVYVPAHNEAGNIPLLAEKISAGCAAAGVDFEIVFVDDGSRDGTLAEMKEVQSRLPSVLILKHRRRLGITETMNTAFQHVKGEIIVWIPADLESDPADDIPLLLGKLKEEELDVVCGWRQGRDDGKNFPSWLYNRLAALIFHVKIHDMNWMKAFRKECLDDLQLRSDWHRFLVMIWAGQGFRIGEVPTRWHGRHRGESKFGRMGLSRMWSMIFDLLVVKFHLSYLKRPMLVFGTAGAAIFSLGFASGAYLLVYRLLEGQVGNRLPFVLLAAFLMLTGIQLAAFGILAEMFVTIRDDVGKLRKKAEEPTAEAIIIK